MVDRRSKCKGNGSVLVIGSRKCTYTNYRYRPIVVLEMRWKEVMDEEEYI